MLAAVREATNLGRHRFDSPRQLGGVRETIGVSDRPILGTTGNQESESGTRARRRSGDPRIVWRADACVEFQNTRCVGCGEGGRTRDGFPWWGPIDDMEFRWFARGSKDQEWGRAWNWICGGREVGILFNTVGVLEQRQRGRVSREKVEVEVRRGLWRKRKLQWTGTMQKNVSPEVQTAESRHNHCCRLAHWHTGRSDADQKGSEWLPLPGRTAVWEVGPTPFLIGKWPGRKLGTRWHGTEVHDPPASP